MAVNDWPEVCALWLRASEAYRRDTTAALEGWHCYYCGDPAQSIDHVVARSLGGGDDTMNLVPVCRPCNSAKAAKTPEAWAAQIRAELARVARKRRQLDALGLLLQAETVVPQAGCSHDWQENANEPDAYYCALCSARWIVAA